MLSLNTNAAALSTQTALANSQKALTTSMTRLGTGYRVNSAMDDAAGLQIATRLNSQTRGMAVAQKNTQNGISMMQTAEGAFSEVTDILQRMKDLATEAPTAPRRPTTRPPCSPSTTRWARSSTTS
jgi:flagellin